MTPAVIHPHWVVLLELTAEYFFMTLAAVLGVIQAAASFSGRDKLSFFNRPVHGYIFAFLTTGPAMAGFFTWNWRNATGLVEGSQQFIYFTIACACAVGLSLLLSWSVRQAGLRVPDYDRLKRNPRAARVPEEKA